MSAVGLEKRVVCGRVKRVRREDLTEFARVFAPEAFSMMELS
jgi:hypothetical protein